MIVIVIGVVIFFSIPVPEQSAYVQINGVRVNIEIADNFEERAKGLMFRDRLPENTGMLFVFENEGNYPFWMMNMRFSLDMIWIDSDGKVVYVAKDVPPCSLSCRAIDPNNNAKYVLEVDAGFADKYGVVEGSFVRIVLPKP
ncbi:MAG TPA: DUF192 domain-containing protein [Thermodesulfobacteriota bacterium]|nr:DUF192 domain-containing protein [Thermodesulfobacteriota bacterium]